MRLELKHIYLKDIDNKFLLDDINFSVSENDFLSVLSKNENVLNTFIRVLVGTIKPRSGRIFLDSFDITNVSPSDRGIALVSKEPCLMMNLTVYDNIAYPLRKTRMKEDSVEAIVDRIVDGLDLSYLKSVVVKDLSLYQQFIVSLARSISFSPKVIIFDDPLSLIREERHEEYFSFIQKVYEFLDRPIVMYLGSNPKISKRVLTLSENGKLLDNFRKPLVSLYPVHSETLNILKEEYDKNNFINGVSIINQDSFILDAKIENEILYYEENHLNLNKLFMRKFLVDKEVRYIELKNSSFQSFDSGNNLKFLIRSIEELNGCDKINLPSFSLIRSSSSLYKENSLLYYPLDEIYFLDENKERINTIIDQLDAVFNVRVLNQFTKLISIGGLTVKLSKEIRKDMKSISLDRKSVFSLSLNKKEGLEIKEIFSFEEYESFFFLTIKVKESSEPINVIVDKNLSPLDNNKIYLVIKDSNIKLSSY